MTGLIDGFAAALPCYRERRTILSPECRPTMSDLSDLLRPEAVVSDLGVGSKKALLQSMAALVAPQIGLDTRLVADRLGERERLGSTGFGHGVAIPHGRIEGLSQIVGGFARLAQPVGYQAVDDLPVDLVFLLLSPVDAGADHLKALARVSRTLRDQRFLDKLRGAGSRDALYALFTTDEARDAA